MATVSADQVYDTVATGPADLIPLRILVVEDDPFTLTILRKRLCAGGFTVETAVNGRDALNKLMRFGPDLILSDWMMPEVDGQELCARIKANPATAAIYFILLTAKDKSEEKISALDTGADEYLVKPCDGSELMARLRAAGRILRLQHQLQRSNSDLAAANERINAELQATSNIQRSLLPQDLPQVTGYEFAAHYQPSTECSGDFYDVLTLDDGRLGLAIGDVSGHGTPAMVAMALTHMVLHQFAPSCNCPAQLLDHINTQLWRHLPTEQYATMFYGILNPVTGHIVYSSAGQNPPLAVAPRSRPAFLAGCEGFPLKLLGPDAEYTIQKLLLPPGQNLILYTDGLVEAFNPEGQLFGSEGLIHVVETVAELQPRIILSHLLDELDRFRRGHPLEDDLSLLIIRRD